MKRIISLALVLGLIISAMLIYFEPEVVKAVSDSIYVTQTVSSEITISSPDDVTMSDSIPGITGNKNSPRTGSVTWTIKCNDADGYTVSVKAASSPAMKLDSTYYFSDYTPAVSGTPDYNWSSPAAGDAEFGYTVNAAAADTVTKFKDNGSSCNTGSNNSSDTCWYNFSTSDEQIIDHATGPSGSSGDNVQLAFKTESNEKFLKEGNYVATITATATVK
jgi:hypothetical protein